MSKWLALLKNGNIPEDNATNATHRDLTEERQSFVAFVACIPGSFPEKDASNDPDRWCWPRSQAMNSSEIETFQSRLSRFTNRGLSYDDAERYADKLVGRDRELDDRRLCVECAHLQVRWRCGNWKAANAGGHNLSRDFVLILQRCPGFTNALAL
jgi:hypothetical protein